MTTLDDMTQSCPRCTGDDLLDHTCGLPRLQVKTAPPSAEQEKPAPLPPVNFMLGGVRRALEVLSLRIARRDEQAAIEVASEQLGNLRSHLASQAAEIERLRVERGALLSMLCDHCIKTVPIDQGCLKCRLAEAAVMVVTRDAAIARMTRDLIAKHGGCWEDPGFLYAAIASIPPDAVMGVGGGTVRVKDWLHDRLEMLRLPAVAKDPQEDR